MYQFSDSQLSYLKIIKIKWPRLPQHYSGAMPSESSTTGNSTWMDCLCCFQYHTEQVRFRLHVQSDIIEPINDLWILNYVWELIDYVPNMHIQNHVQGLICHINEEHLKGLIQFQSLCCTYHLHQRIWHQMKSPQLDLRTCRWDANPPMWMWMLWSMAGAIGICSCMRRSTAMFRYVRWHYVNGSVHLINISIICLW